MPHLVVGGHMYSTLISCCESSTAYYLFSHGQSIFFQWYSVALYKRLFSRSGHTGLLNFWESILPD